MSLREAIPRNNSTGVNNEGVLLRKKLPANVLDNFITGKGIILSIITCINKEGRGMFYSAMIKAF